MKKTTEESTTKTQQVTIEPSIKPNQVTHHVPLWKASLALFLSRKFIISLTAFGLTFLFHEITIKHLYTLNEPHQTSALTTIYVATLSVIGMILAAFVGSNAYSAKFGITGAAQMIGQTISQDVHKVEDTNINENVNENYTEHIIEEGQSGAPEVRPFSQNAIEGDSEYDS